jgi:hypothetical protein
MPPRQVGADFFNELLTQDTSDPVTLSEASLYFVSAEPKCLILIDYMTNVIEINQILSPRIGYLAGASLASAKARPYRSGVR